MKIDIIFKDKDTGEDKVATREFKKDEIASVYTDKRSSYLTTRQGKLFKTTTNFLHIFSIIECIFFLLSFFDNSEAITGK